MEPERSRGPGGSRETAASGRGLGLTFVEGRAVLGLEGKPLAPVGRVDRLEMELPNLRFPFDVSGGVGRFASRRCRLRELTVSLSATDVAQMARAAHLSDFGIFDPHFTVDAGVLRVEARVRVGAREADLTARG